MLIPIRNPQTGKLLLKWDFARKLIQIVQHKKSTTIHLNDDGTYQVSTKTVTEQE